MRPIDFLSMAALSLITAYGLWQIAIRQPDPIQVRFIDLPPVTEADLLTSGIDRQTLSEYLELKTSVQMGSTPSTASKSNNHISNLAWGTAQDNANDRELHGRTTNGWATGNVNREHHRRAVSEGKRRAANA